MPTKFSLTSALLSIGNDTPCVLLLFRTSRTRTKTVFPLYKLHSSIVLMSMELINPRFPQYCRMQFLLISDRMQLLSLLIVSFLSIEIVRFRVQLGVIVTSIRRLISLPLERGLESGIYAKSERNEKLKLASLEC